MGLWGLFVSAFVSATLLPGSSEVVLIGLLAKYPELIWPAIVVATIGNTGGGLTSYWLGRLLPNRAKGNAIAWVRKFGVWTLLLSWLPLIGDALCVAAGWMRFNAWSCLVLLAMGKFLRYVLVAGGTRWILNIIWM